MKLNIDYDFQDFTLVDENELKLSNQDSKFSLFLWTL